MPTHDLDNATGFWMHLAFNRLRAESVREIERLGHGVTPEQWAILVRLWQRDGRTQTELAESTFRDKPSVTRMLDSLERAGLVERHLDDHDRRVRRIHLTDAGHALEGELVPEMQRWIAHCFRDIATEDLQTTRRVLRQVYANLER